MEADPDPAELAAYDALRAYTLTHGDPAFLHQHVVDAWTAQHAGAQTKPIALAFALIGLYLHVERGHTGRQVQRVHMALGRRKRAWPPFSVPDERASLTALDVLAHPAGPERDQAIHRWCAAVWDTFRDSRAQVIGLLAEHGIA